MARSKRTISLRVLTPAVPDAGYMQDTILCHLHAGGEPCVWEIPCERRQPGFCLSRVEVFRLFLNHLVVSPEDPYRHVGSAGVVACLQRMDVTRVLCNGEWFDEGQIVDEVVGMWPAECQTLNVVQCPVCNVPVLPGKGLCKRHDKILRPWQRSAVTGSNLRLQCLINLVKNSLKEEK